MIFVPVGPNIVLIFFLDQGIEDRGSTFFVTEPPGQLEPQELKYITFSINIIHFVFRDFHIQK